MSYAVISDVHANLHALLAVLDDINSRGITEIYFTGDVVGYGPKPNECIDLIKQNCKIILAGNHDWASIGYTDITYFNQYAKHAISWTIEELTDEHFQDLTRFNLVKSIDNLDAFFVHSTPLNPELWSYLFTVEKVQENFSAFTQSLCFVGHSHISVIFELLGDDHQRVSGRSQNEIFIHNSSVIMEKKSRYIVNTGSVGQPRDNDNRSSYGLIHDDLEGRPASIEIVRVPYDIGKTQKEMKEVGMPDMLINRLSLGV